MVVIARFPQHGGCFCGDVRYVLREEPLALSFPEQPEDFMVLVRAWKERPAGEA